MLLFNFNFPYWGPLVPNCSGPTCTFCHLLQLAQNVINFLLTLSLFLAVIFIVWGAIMMMLSAGNEKNFESAKKIMTGAVIGVAVVLGSYIILNTFFLLISGQPNFPWYKINC